MCNQFHLSVSHLPSLSCAEEEPDDQNSFTRIFFLNNAYFLYKFLLYRALTVSMFLISLRIYTKSVGLLRQVNDPPQGLYHYTGQHKQNKHTLNIHARSGIRTHDRSVRASEDSSCLRPLGYRNRLTDAYILLNSMILITVLQHIRTKPEFESQRRETLLGNGSANTLPW
jgi:hypothetical protein